MPHDAGSYLVVKECSSAHGPAASISGRSDDLEGRRSAFDTHIQSIRVAPGQIVRSNLLPGLARVDPAAIIDPLIGEVERLGSFRQAEANFQEILPLLGSATADQMVRLLNVSATNGQVLYAHLVSGQYLPPITARVGQLVDDEVRRTIESELQKRAD